MSVFVVQQHDATTLHFDFRLEVGRVMKSWAVPKGPSYDPADKRLAMEVDDHPKSWNRFEGRIGAGYGKGAVIIWDRGTFEPLDEDFAAALDAGQASFVLHGEKLRGGWMLRRWGESRGRPKWLLIKRRDEEADPARDIVSERPESVVSGKTVLEV